MAPRLFVVALVAGTVLGMACFPSLPPEEDTAEADTAEPDTAEPDTAEADAWEADTAEPDTADTVESDVGATCSPACEPTGDPCRQSRCDAERGECEVVDAPSGTVCDDGQYCTVGDACIAGVCLGAPRGCDDGLACTVDSCDESTASCKHDGASCECGPGVSCDDGDPCNGEETCDLTTFSCVAGTPLPDNVPCDDGRFCTIDDRCREGLCQGTARSCDDGIPCTVDACDEEELRCINDPGACACTDNSGCPDANLCDGQAWCDIEQNLCDPGTPVACGTPSNQCKSLICDPTTGGCDEVNRSGACDDGLACTTLDVCDQGTCVGTAPICKNGGVCTPEDSCDCAETGYSGSTCETPVCALSCLNGGTCTAPNTCSCPTGYSGPTCATPICTEACQNGGTCTAPDTCTCPAGYGGEQCEVVFCGLLGVVCPANFTCTAAGTCERAATNEVFVPSGTFWMGCNAALEGSCPSASLAQHHVTLSAFAIDKTEVTAAQYGACYDAGACTKPNSLSSTPHATHGVAGKEQHPINYVTWHHASAYCAWSSKAAGVQRLCTEAEWERAARGGCELIGPSGSCEASAMRPYPWGPKTPTCQHANFDTCGGTTAPVGSSPLGDSPYGAQDMAGNVQEWVADWYEPSFDADPATNPTGPSTGTERAIRSNPFHRPVGWSKASFRSKGEPGASGLNTGLRCCRTVAP